MAEIEVAGETLQLLPEKALYWPREKTLFIADFPSLDSRNGGGMKPIK